MLGRVMRRGNGVRRGHLGAGFPGGTRGAAHGAVGFDGPASVEFTEECAGEFVAVTGASTGTSSTSVRVTCCLVVVVRLVVVVAGAVVVAGVAERGVCDGAPGAGGSGSSSTSTTNVPGGLVAPAASWAGAVGGGVVMATVRPDDEDGAPGGALEPVMRTVRVVVVVRRVRDWS